MTASDGAKNMLSLPWVKPAKRGIPCDGIKWGSLAMRDIPHRHHLPPDHRARCKRNAKFVFRATKRLRMWDAPATSGSYCQTHASMQISNHGAELRRANAWWDKNGWWRNGVFGKHEIGESA